MSWTPNLIIAGVAKCGTTTLHDLLVVHPRVTGGIEKEVRFLMDEDDELCPTVNVRSSGLEAWASQYADRGLGDYDVWVDASPQYQYQSTSKSVIGGLSASPKVLFIVRDPARRLFSLYQYARYHQRVMPHISSFAQFIEEIREPVSGPLAKQKMMVSAWRDTLYDEMLADWSAFVPAERLHVLSLEDLSSRRRETLTGLARWLDIDPAPLVDAEVERANPTVVTKSRFLRSVGARAAKVLPDNAAVRALKTRVREMNSARIDPGEFESNAELLANLEREFAPHMRRFDEIRQELRLARA